MPLWSVACHFDPFYGSGVKYFMEDLFSVNKAISQFTEFIDCGSVCRILEGNREGLLVKMSQ